MNDIPDTKEEFYQYVLKKYEKEIRISKKVFFPSFAFLVLVMTYFGFNKPVSTEMFLVFVVLFSIPASLSCVSLQAYCLSKYYLLRWKERGI